MVCLPERRLVEQLPPRDELDEDPDEVTDGLGHREADLDAEISRLVDWKESSVEYIRIFILYPAARRPTFCTYYLALADGENRPSAYCEISACLRRIGQTYATCHNLVS